MADSPSSPPPQQYDDISLFLHQILLRSSSSLPLSPFSDISYRPPSPPPPPPPPPLSESNSIWTPISGSAVASSSSVGNTDTDHDEHDCESEDGFEEDLRSPPAAPGRSSSKRSRAAEVHNLSEKRRRSKINEKMKALQKLVPNSNKTDKASMLDEAIDYLKQLQLQVQMLTMRKGTSLYPSNLLQQTQLSHIKMKAFCEDNNPLANILPTIINQEQHHMNHLLLTNDPNQLGIQNLLAQSEQELNMIPDFQSLFPLNAKGGLNSKDEGLEACILRSDRHDDDDLPL